jgi:hypothetical protein
MPPLNRFTVGGAIIAVLLLFNLYNFFFADWGLITVRVHEAPLGQVIKSIERQGHITIYSNLDPSSTISMDVIRVSVPEAMDSLAANAGGSDGFRGAQWHLGFFAAPSSAAVKEEVRGFESGSTGDDNKVFSYPTPLQTLSGEEALPAADPRKQSWPGLRPATPATAPAPVTAAAQGNPPPSDNPSSDQPPAPPSTVQDYLDALAQAADIYVMVPTSWEPKISGPPSTGSSISSAVRSVVGKAHGSVDEAFILYERPRGQRGPGGPGRGGFGGGDANWAATDDRLKNAINGLPEDYRAGALAQLSQEKSFHQQLAAAPPDQRRDMWRKHMMDRPGMFDNWHMSPEKRAQRYQRAVSNRQSARGT